MCDHDDQPVFSHLFEQIHHLYTRLAVQCSCRLISQQYIRIIDKCPGYCNPLHLAAGELVRLLMHLLAQSYLRQRFPRSLPALCLSDS